MTVDFNAFTDSSGTLLPTWLIMLVLAPIIGSFLGVVARRLDTERSILWGRSACESCGGTVAAFDLVPLVSFLVLRGRCRWCRARISLGHPAIEIAAIVVALWATTVDGGGRLVVSCLLGWTLLGLALCDFVRLRLPDAMTLPLLLAGLVTTAVWLPAALTNHALAAALGYGLFRLLGAVYRRLRGVSGLGQGDAKLLAASGAWLGVLALPNLILLAAASALVFALILKAWGRAIDMRTRLPFGPFIALATWLLWLYGGAMSSNLLSTYWLS
jgi:leader peptidase (prepilin peptidase)/N-methyltransferase